MISDRDIELAHPDAFDFAWGNLPAAKRAEFDRHLAGCRYCQAVVDEYSEIGQIIKLLPPHVEPPADLEDRTVAAMVAALAEQRATTDRRPDAEDQVVTRLHPAPAPASARTRDSGSADTQFQPPAGTRRSSGHRPSTRRHRPSRRPRRWSLGCLCGGVTEAAWPLSSPWPRRSSRPPSSSRSALAEAGSPRPKPQW